MKNADIVAQAREYLGTPFQPKGRVLGEGVDCVGLVLVVAGNLGLVDKDGTPLNGQLYTDYSDQPVGRYVHDLCMKHLLYVPVRLARPGNVVTIDLGTAPCHVGFLGSDPSGALTLIHAYNGGTFRVVEHPVDIKWFRRLRGGFTFPGVTD